MVTATHQVPPHTGCQAGGISFILHKDPSWKILLPSCPFLGWETEA